MTDRYTKTVLTVIAVEDVQGDALCGDRIMFGDVSALGDKIVNAFRRP